MARGGQVTRWLLCAPRISATAKAWGRGEGTHDSVAWGSVRCGKEENYLDTEPGKNTTFIGLLTGLVTACVVLPW